MTDVDKWISISKECKYLPENDLKASRVCFVYLLLITMVNCNGDNFRICLSFTYINYIL